jgi:hypothetical protein
MRYYLGILGFLAALLSPPLLAQEVTGVILGTVRDASGAVVPGVKVTITERATSAVRTATTDNEGTYVVPLLPPGTYTVAAEHPGMQRAIRNNVQVQITERIPSLELRVGSLRK